MGDPAPLFGPSQAPHGGQAQWFIGAGGARLRAALFSPPGEVRGSVVISPGRTEPIEKYFEVVTRLQGRGFKVLVHDWRGQGLSQRLLADRLLGHARGHGDFLADFSALQTTYEAALPPPWIALGHSMGGCLTLLALAYGERRFSAAILSAPMLGILTGAVPRPIGRMLANASARVGRGGRPVQPRGAGALAFEDNILTHDRARYERNEALILAHPDLALGAPTWGWLDFAFSATAVLQRGAGAAAIVTPVTVVAAGDEKLVDNDASRRVAARLPNGRFVEIPGAFHEILQETDDIQAVFWREFDELAQRL